MRAVAVRFPLLFSALALSPGLSLTGAEDMLSEGRIERLFRPRQGERLALSTDGHYLATTQHVGTEEVIEILDLEKLERKTRIIADEDRPVLHSKELQRSRLRFLEWASADRLVFAPEAEIIPSGGSLPTDDFKDTLRYLGTPLPDIAPFSPTVLAPIMAVNVDGTQPRQLLDPKDLQTASASTSATAPGVSITPLPVIRGFAAGDRENLLIEVRGNVREGMPTTLYRLNVHTGKLAKVDDDFVSGRLFFDRTGKVRLNQLSDRKGGIYYEYRAPNSTKWIKMPEPADSGPAGRFTRTPATYFAERAIPLGFDTDPNVLIYASNIGRDTFGLFSFNLATRQPTSLSLQHPRHDLASLDAEMSSPSLVYDKFRATFAGVRAWRPQPFTVWADAEIAGVQRAAEEKFPGRSVQLLEWNEARTRFLSLVTGGTEPGRIFLFQHPEGLMVELLRRAPWLPAAELHTTSAFAFAGPGGSELTGFLTLPRRSRINPPPLLIWLAPGLPSTPHPEFDAQAQVLADLGFVVCRLNQRGTTGFGQRHREALRRDLDHATAEDTLATIEWIAAHQRIDRRRVALLGEGFAAHLALRAAQVHPEAFRCAIVFDPILSLVSWSQENDARRLYFEGSGARLSQLSVTAHADELNTPVMIISRSDTDPVLAAGASDLRSQLKKRDIPTVSLEYNSDFSLGLPKARLRVYREIEEFLNLNLYNYDVRVGPTRVVK
jgi:dienelactone hydrolase